MVLLVPRAYAQNVYRWGAGGTFAGVVTGTGGVSSGAYVVGSTYLASGGLATTALPTLAAGQYGIVWDTTAAAFKAWNGSAWVNWNSMVGVSGSLGSIPKFTGSNTLGNSAMSDSGTEILTGEDLRVQGAFSFTPYVATGPTTYTAASQSIILANAAGGAVTINLPAASNRPGRVYMIVKTDNSANTVTVARNGADTIQGATSVILTTQYDSLTIESDNSSVWYKTAQTGSLGNQTLQQVTAAGATTTIAGVTFQPTSGAPLIATANDNSAAITAQTNNGGQSLNAQQMMANGITGGTVVTVQRNSGAGAIANSNPVLYVKDASGGTIGTGPLIRADDNTTARFWLSRNGTLQIDQATYASAGWISTDASGNLVKNVGTPVTGGPYLPLGGGTMTGGIGNGMTTFDAYVAGAVPASNNAQSLVRLGNNVTAASANGTYLGMNANNGFTGNFIDLQNNSAKEFSVSASGAVTAVGYATSASSGAVTTGSVLGFTGVDLTLTPGTGQYVNINAGSGLKIGSAAIRSGAGSPNSVVIGNVGDLYLNTSGGAGTTLYVKESGAGTNTGWVGK